MAPARSYPRGTGSGAGVASVVHARRISAVNWRYALLFPDWLRANDDERDEYARLKVRLAARHSSDGDFDDYEAPVGGAAARARLRPGSSYGRHAASASMSA
ncbi:GrpB family protein [Microbacterium imperiale]|uniref:GrpB family protein n=1 Tax=Microbacterium imperiale TaxID=33884 RepID=UPI0027DC6CDB|nr:GrpB family protein [Microbacterium imperiale]